MSVDNPAPVTSTNTTPLGKSRRPSTTGLAPTIDRAKTDSYNYIRPEETAATPKITSCTSPQQQPARRSSSGATAATPPRSTASIWTSTTPAPPIIASAPAMPPPTSAGISVFKQTPSIPVPPTLNPSLLASARSTTPVQPPPKEPPLEERQRLWEERTKTISARDTHRKTLQRLEQQIRELEALTSLRSGRPDVIQKLKALRVKRDEEQAAMNAAMKRLVESNSWPMGEASKSSKEVEKDRKNEEALRELLRLTETLNLRIAKADALVKDLGGQDQSSNSDDKMDVDDKQEGPSSRPLKRRRLSNDVSEPVAAPTLRPQYFH
ncbi:hypothetical protein VNI00_003348 [Paramarasmius palmivorus]|uniref:Uncharacterized protein n=1 Tax=Paramarasmius palmivorus TaxID=297713 RepID=A0AAW0DUN4_9AGAR